MKNIDRFTFFSSYHEATKELSDRDRKSILVAIVDYVFENKTPEFKGSKKSIWSLIVPHLEVSKSKSSNAKKKSNENQNEIKIKSNENQSETCPLSEKKEEGNKEIKKGERGIESEENQNFSPTLPQILEYAFELGIEDKEYCEKFYNHYSGIGWVNGTGQEIIDWQSVFKNWVKKDKKDKSQNEDANYRVGSTKGLPRL